VGCICRPDEEENFWENLFGSGSLEHQKDNIKIDLGLWGWEEDGTGSNHVVLDLRVLFCGCYI
jgi:hypothetical protein